MDELGIDILFSSREMKWGKIVVPMKKYDDTVETSFFVKESAEVQAEIDRLLAPPPGKPRILDADYQKVEVAEIVKKQRT